MSGKAFLFSENFVAQRGENGIKSKCCGVLTLLRRDLCGAIERNFNISHSSKLILEILVKSIFLQTQKYT